MVARFRLYLDESGDHTFKSLDQGENRFLALLGVWFEMDKDYLAFDQELRSFKDGIFGPRPDEPVILHREDILKRRGVFYRLRENAVERAFNDGLLGVISAAEFKMCCVLIDKLDHESKSYRTLFHPYHYCLAALLERYVGLLNRGNDRGDVLAESRGGTEDQQLKRAFVNVYECGTRFHGADQFKRALTSKEIKLKKKLHCISGLELADILANPIRRLMIAERRKQKPNCGSFGNRIVAAVEPKFNRHLYNGRVKGYGKVFLD